ncbi:MAG: DNA polymerase III subunit alpha [Planctomycetota bacterium]
MKKNSPFVHLHVHSHYSLLDGACRHEELVQTAREMGMPSLAVTDHGNLFGAIEFYKTAVESGIKPILGCEVYVAPGSRHSRESKTGQESSQHLVLLIKNERGYKNLIQLVTLANIEGFYYKPRVDKEILRKYADGLVATSSCLHSEISMLIANGHEEIAENVASDYSDIFGKDNFYLEVMDHGIPDQKPVNEGIFRLQKRLDIPVVATNDVHYMKRDDWRAHDALLCINTGKLLSDEDRLRMSAPEFYFKSPEEMKIRFANHPEVITNTLEVAGKCNLELDLSSKHLPHFQSIPGRSNSQHLRDLCRQGAISKYGTLTTEIEARLEYELKTIETMGFVSYFLIVRDFVHYAKSQGIPVGPGRGSAAGSIVSYTLDITNIDPLRYGCLFERFLDINRKQLPDVDIDFCMLGRDRIIDYVKQKYGSDNVAQIITFGTMAARGAIRDVGRVLNFPVADVDRIAKKVPETIGIQLKKALEQEPDLKQLYDMDERYRDLFDIAMRLEGLCRHASKHAAGVVISDKPLTEYLPLYRNGDVLVTQYPMESLESIGMLKMDFLGLRTLTVIARTVEIVQKTRGIDIDTRGLPLDDIPTYRLLQNGETHGVFQFESSGMRDLIRQLRPDRFEDIIAMVALYRPGPLGSGMIQDFIRRKHGEIPVQYPDPRLESILKETYGVMVYQEQVMQIVHRLGGLSLTEAYNLIKAISKKKREVIENLRGAFLGGARKNQLPAKEAENLFEQINYFGGYGFNKSHSTAYALLAYQTAYLKSNFPTEYMAALMTFEMGDTDKIVEYIEECHRMGMEVLPPDINESSSDFTVIQNKIRFGLSAVKNAGNKAVESILRAREKSGPFQSLFHFCEVVDMRLVNKRALESLIGCGAFDSLGARRSQLVAALEDAMRLGDHRQTDQRRGQMSFLDSLPSPLGSVRLPDIPEWPETERLAHEKKILGYFVSSHPLVGHENILRSFSSSSTADVINCADGVEIILGGIIASMRSLTTKKGERMAMFDLADFSGRISCVLFPRIYAAHAELLSVDRIVFVLGKLDLSRDNPQIIVDEMIPLENATERLARSVWIHIPPFGSNTGLLKEIRNVLASHPGACPVILKFQDNGNETYVRTANDLSVSATVGFLNDLDRIVGREHVYFRS